LDLRQFICHNLFYHVILPYVGFDAVHCGFYCPVEVLFGYTVKFSEKAVIVLFVLQNGWAIAISRLADGFSSRSDDTRVSLVLFCGEKESRVQWLKVNAPYDTFLYWLFPALKSN
jgi:hypothetical protein